jgi:hypothetical protein
MQTMFINLSNSDQIVEEVKETITVIIKII